MTFNLGILEVGRPPEELMGRYGSYAEMFEAMLREHGADWNYVIYPVLDGQMPQTPHSCDGWLITGSRHGVYEDVDWIPPLKEFIRAAYDQHVPLLGICFGHQIIAEALGGKVMKSDKGWGVGVHTYYVLQNPDWMPEGMSSFAIEAFHQDQVVKLPEDGEVLASSEFCEFAAIDYKGRALSFQGHPEFSESFAVDLTEGRRGLSLTDEETDAAIKSSRGSMQRGQIAKTMINFIQQAAVREKQAEM